MTYLVSSVSRRDYLGSANSCKSIVLPRLMREHAVIARADDAWDLNCEPRQYIRAQCSLNGSRPCSGFGAANGRHDNED